MKDEVMAPAYYVMALCLMGAVIGLWLLLQSRRVPQWQTSAA